MTWQILLILYDVYDSIKVEMEAEMQTCCFPDDHRYLLLDVARRRANIEPRDVEGGIVPEVDDDAIEKLLDFYYDLRLVKWTIRNKMFLE